ncbi:MAG: COX15/CtaA family protein [Chloroflexota bacterium]
MSGAVTALGDTLFPAGSLAEGVQQDFASTAHFLVRLRVWHPIIAILTGVYLIAVSTVIYGEKPDHQTWQFMWALRILVVVQLVAGFANVILLAPVWMQIVHLLLADLVWISAVLFGASALSVEAVEAEATNTTPLAPQAGD